MPVRKKQFARARLGAVCVAASVIAGAITAPSAWSVTADEIEVVPRSDAPVAPVIPDEESDEGVPTPAPGETETPSPAPTSEPSPTDGEPTPAPTTSPAPSPSSPADPPPTVPVEQPPAPTPPRIETDAQVELRASTAIRLGALLRLAPRGTDMATPTPEPSDAVHIDGGPDVGGSAQLGASVPAEDPTGRTDAVRVGSLHDGSGEELTRPVVWAPWAGALALAGAGVAILVLRGGRQIGR
ncbi:MULTISPECIES: hypothetical protein [Microbacterium]|uniref:hypothetical protein n=1 Tax=Microbacterium TaxID=33882 RepID=UPI00249DD42C|nr:MULTISPECIES: hypothetical protein [Microbacterium]WHE37513.1 hypothetical protein P6897_07365 [Microbacterium sp. BDGP8]WRK18693.1 hypothetical protein VC184_06755 [Microbacterium plantarum]